MEITINQITKEEWNGFLVGQTQALFLHSWEWGDFLSASGRREMLRFAIYEDERVIGLYPICLKRRKFMISTAESIPVHHVGGPVVSRDYGHDKFMVAYGNLIMLCDDYLKENGVLSMDVVIWDPSIDSSVLQIWQELDYSINNGNMFVYRMPSCMEEIDKTYRYKYCSSVKHGIKKGAFVIKNGRVDINKIYELYMMSLDKAHIDSRYTCEEMREVCSWSEKNKDLLVCYDKSGGIAAFAIFLKFNGNAIYWLSGMNREYKNLNPTNLIIDSFLKCSLKEGIRVVDFGGGCSDKLSHFKFSIGTNKETVYTFSKVYQRKKKYLFDAMVQLYGNIMRK